MKCIHHLDRDACAQCATCGKFLCNECATIWNPPLCQDCGAAAEKAEKDKTKSMITWAVILGIIGIALGCCICAGASADISGKYIIQYFFVSAAITLMFGYCFASIPFGWKAVRFIKLENFLILPLVGWLIYFGIKFMLAYFVGLFAMPVYIVKAIIRHVREKQSS